MNSKILSILVVSLSAASLAIPQAFASQSNNLTPQKTNVVLDTGSPSNQAEGFSVATPDGRYVEIQSKDGKQSWLESMTGQRYAVPNTGIKIYDSTPNGDVVMWGPAGPGVVKYVYRPGVGVIKNFPDKGDAFAAAAHGAFESTKGNWVTLNSNVSDGDVLVESWTNVNGQYVPLLNNLWQVAWSPDGTDLAAVLSNGYGNSGNWLVIYNEKTQKRNIVQTNPFSLPTLLEPIRGGIKWDGVFLGVMTSNGIIVFDSMTGATTTIPVSDSTQWGFSGHQLWILENQNGSTSVRAYGLIDNMGSVFPLVNQNLPWDKINSNFLQSGGRVLVEHDTGTISLITLNPTNKLTIQNVANSSGHPWWYDTQNGYVYYGGTTNHTTQTESVWRVELPKTESYSYSFSYQNREYLMSSLYIKAVGKEIGNTVNDGGGVNVSEPPLGTKLFAIPGTPTDVAIAVEISAGVYQKAYSTTSAH